jgi:hypothetical protein
MKQQLNAKKRAKRSERCGAALNPFTTGYSPLALRRPCGSNGRQIKLPMQPHLLLLLLLLMLPIETATQQNRTSLMKYTWPLPLPCLASLFFPSQPPFLCQATTAALGCTGDV